MKIGDVDIPGRFVLAPMAAVNCTAFRMLCKENKASLIYTQMIEATLVENKSRREVSELLNIQELERPVSVQLIGNNEASLIRSVEAVEEFADIIDLNVGCSEKEILEQRIGAYLLSDLPLLENLVRKMVEATDKPVTVKIRIGMDAQNISAVKVSQLLENAGVAAIAIHGRTVEQKMAKKVNWTIMKQVKEKIGIPLMANGDVTSYAEGVWLLERTGCDFVMVGRGARDRPWIFDVTKAQMGNEGIRRQILRFIELYREFENRGSAQEVREHVFWMLKDFKTQQNTRSVMNCKSIKAVEDFVESLK
ncbi:MAG: tRNA dihydrouridine synthase [Candidatus Bathyarchaeia archaeon]|jgi:nifR3 family TIM-barrel protein